MTGNTVTQMAEGIPTTEPEKPLAIGERLISSSRKVYDVEKMLEERTEPILACVYLAKYGQPPRSRCLSLILSPRDSEAQRKYVLKNIYHTEFEYQLDMQQPLFGRPNLRTLVDTIPEHLLFVYEYLADDLLNLAMKDNLSDITRRRILRDALVGLADLHENGIFHTGMMVLSFESLVFVLTSSGFIRHQTKQHICRLRGEA